ncbi:ParB/RepB/Spo0J family partition protein [Enterocloster lavalensis]|uniref:ParB/RepB/Spo0J family partition protein n=1 Tax=Enterocloster lavalensis TaxID=460384 RepID=UPI001FA89872|nr:ParB N-terminal domain-containing protein [Enterocloster lavalensis]
MGKWSVMELIGMNTEPDKQDFQEIYLSPYEVEASETNFYSQENIEELADSIRMVGQQQPTVLGRVDGVYKIISGHRRNLANIHNIETGAFPWDYQAKYLYKDMTPAMLELSLIVGNAFNRRLTPYEETEQAARLKAALIRARDEDGLEIAGKLRDVVADILQTSAAKVGRMNKINNSLVPEAKEQFKAGKLGQSAAYEAARLPEEEQRQIAAQAAAGEKVQHKDVAQKVTEKKAEQAAARAEKAAKKAEAAQTAAAQAGLQAERAAESADSSATLTSAHMNPPEPDEQQEWTTRDWAIYHLRELMGVASYITEDDLIILQDILMAATGRRDNERH